MVSMQEALDPIPGTKEKENTQEDFSTVRTVVFFLNDQFESTLQCFPLNMLSAAHSQNQARAAAVSQLPPEELGRPC